MMFNRYLMPMFVVAISLGVYFLYIDNAYKNIIQQLAHEQVIEEFLTDAQNAKEKLDKITTEYRSFPTGADQRLEVFLPNKIDPVRLIIDVNAIAEKHGLILSSPSVTLGKPSVDMPTPYLEHQISFKVTATYPAFKDFLRDIESSLAIRDFDQIAFSSPATEELSGVATTDPEFLLFDYQVALKTYSLE